MWKIDSIASKGQYFYARVPDHPKATARGYVLLHRIIVENSLGRILEDHEIVHHLNEDKKDNRIENLEVMSRGEHTRLHIVPSIPLELTCDECDSNFTRPRNQRAENKGYKRAFCSRSCAGRFSRREQLVKEKA